MGASKETTGRTVYDMINTFLRGGYTISINTILILFIAGFLFYYMNSLSNEIKEIRKEVAELKRSEDTHSKEIQNNIEHLKINDFLHTNKSILYLASEVLKDNPDRFTLIKNTILETTPENKKSEIESIRINRTWNGAIP
jgi:hypothetical protein